VQENAWLQHYIRPLIKAEGADELRDDVALLTAPPPAIITMDTLIEGRHFLPTDPLFTVGQKLIRVNVSDIHAKGALPHEALLSIAWPAASEASGFQQLMAGMDRDMRQYGIDLIGGDLVSTDGPLTLTLTLTGRCLGQGPVRRRTGQAGHGLYVSGEIGWGLLGLEAARSDKDLAEARYYQVPQISTAEAAALVARQASASLDVSDGLLLDASRLADASGCGYHIDLAHIPFAQGRTERKLCLDLCTAGDDYCILMAAPPDRTYQGFVQIGCLTEQMGGRLSDSGQAVALPERLGFQHG